MTTSETKAVLEMARAIMLARVNRKSETELTILEGMTSVIKFIDELEEIKS